MFRDCINILLNIAYLVCLSSVTISNLADLRICVPQVSI